MATTDSMAQREGTSFLVGSELSRLNKAREVPIVFNAWLLLPAAE